MAKSKDTAQKIAEVDDKLAASTKELATSLAKAGEATEDATKSLGLFGRELAVSKFVRDEHGLLKNVTYKFEEDGSVDWKAMIPSKYIVVNKDYFEKRNIDVPTSTEGLADKQLMILLAGFKELAVIRGISSVEKIVRESSHERAVVECTIHLAPNYESENGMPVMYTEVANATLANTNPGSQLFLETIASNRAFVRAVRNALRIDIVGEDEMNSVSYGPDSEETGKAEAWMALATAARTAVTKDFPNGFKTFEEFKTVLLKKNIEGAEGWQDWKDIPGQMVLKLLGQLNKIQKA